MFFEQMHPTWQQALTTSKPLLDELELKVAARETEMVPAMGQVM